MLIESNDSMSAHKTNSQKRLSRSTAKQCKGNGQTTLYREGGDIFFYKQVDTSDFSN